MIKTICFGHKNIRVQVLALLLPGLLLGQLFFFSLRLRFLFYNRRVRGSPGAFLSAKSLLASL